MHIVINPRAGRGAVKRGWPAVKAVLDHAGVEYTTTITEHAGHGTEATRAAITRGDRYIVAVGGDGTVHEVVNGMMGNDGPVDKEALLGVVAAGSGCDFVKTFGLPQEPEAAARHLLGENIWGRIDVARVHYIGPDGLPASRWFANIAEAGLGADVVAAAARMPRWLGSSVYKLAALKEIARHSPFVAGIDAHGRKARGSRIDTPLGPITFHGEMSLLVVANCQFYGGGMKVAPRAIPSDGMLDVQIATGSKVDAMKVMQKIAKGEHVPNVKILEYLATAASLDAPGIKIEADGEVLGTSPARFDLSVDALRMKV